MNDPSMNEPPMNEPPMHESVERWLGVLSTGVMRDRADERSVVAAARVVGEERLGALREWFAAKPREEADAVQCAVIECCLAIVHADRVVQPAERRAMEALIERSHLDVERRRAMKAAIDKPPRPLDLAIREVDHPVLRELLLVLAWELARADGVLDDAEKGIYGLLAAKLGVPPERAAALRAALA
jgi:uncharacterized tellurite resistance protein B-like protein